MKKQGLETTFALESFAIFDVYSLFQVGKVQGIYIDIVSSFARQYQVGVGF